MLALSCAMHRIVEILLYFKPKGGKSQLKSLSPLLPPSASLTVLPPPLHCPLPS